MAGWVTETSQTRAYWYDVAVIALRERMGDRIGWMGIERAAGYRGILYAAGYPGQVGGRDRHALQLAAPPAQRT